MLKQKHKIKDNIKQFDNQMPTRQTSDSRMIELMLLLKSTGEVRSQAQFCRTINIHKGDIQKVRAGRMSFNSSQIEKACKEFDVNANWIFGIERNIFRGVRNTLPIDKVIARLRRVKGVNNNAAFS